MKRIITAAFFIFLYHIGSSQVWTKKAAIYTGGGGRGPTAFSIPSTGAGYTMGNAPYNFETWKYDTLSDSWIKKNNFIGSADGTQVGFSINGVGYVGSGVSWGCNFYNTFYSYDPAADTWTQLPNVPGPNRGYAVGFAVGGKGYIGGGATGCNGTGLNDFYGYDPTTNKWDTITPCPEFGCNLYAVGFSIGNYGYIGMGDSIASNGSRTLMKDFYQYDPTTDKWTKMADFPGGPRGAGIGFGTCDKGYMGLGFSDANQQVCPTDFYEYDPAKNTWKRLADFGGVGRWVASSFVIGKSCFVTLGVASDNSTQSDIWEYIPSYTPSFSAESSVCSGGTISFTDTSDYSPTNWNWSFPGGTPSSSTIQNPVIQYNTAGTFDVVLSAWNGCDSASRTFSQYVTVGSGGTLTVAANPSFVCSGKPAVLTIASGSGTYRWSPSAGLTDSTSTSITVNPDTTTTYSVSQAGGSGCASTGQVTVMVGNNTIGGIVSAVRDTICQNTSGNLSLAGNSSSVIQWQSSLNDSTFTNSLHDTLTSYKTPPLTQSTWYRATVGTGNCSALSDTFKLIVPPALTASFYFIQPSPSKLNFNSDSSLGSIRSYHWDFGDGTTSTDSNPSHPYAKDSTYYVCLTLFDGSNCSYTFCKYSEVTDGVPTISAEGSWLIYPNPFSEQLKVRGKHTNSPVQSIEMYDVLGQLVLNKNLDNGSNTSVQLDVSTLAKGMYYVMIRTVNADYVQKVVKQ